MQNHRKFGRAGVTVALCALVSLLSLLASAASAAVVPRAAKPQTGGTVILGGFLSATLDPGNPAWTQGGLALGVNIFGSLFTSTKATGGNPLGIDPDLATGYEYAKGFKTLTLHIRPHVHFQDGTPLNAAAVKANFERSVPAGATTVSQYFSLITRMTVTNANTLVVHFKSPDANFINALADTAAGLMVSPTALSRMGEAAFSLKPVGAGAFEVVSDQPSQQLMLKRFPGYWDAKHVYLSNVEYLNVGTEAQTELADLVSNTVQSLVLTTTTAPSVLQQALSKPDLTAIKGGNLMVNFLQINTFRAPFNNKLAREAIDYCTDRNAINNNVDGGYSAPGWVFAGYNGLYYPKGGLAAAKKMQPYQYNPVKGKQIVQQLGGCRSPSSVGPVRPRSPSRRCSRCGRPAG